MKNNIYRILLFLILIFIGLSGPVWLFILGAALYIIVYTGVEIIFLALAIDAYFGYASGGYYIYTIITAAGLYIVQWAKPHIWVYNQ